MLARSPSQAFAPMHDLLAAPPPADLASLLASLRQVEALLDAMPGVVFFVKDERARYVLVNRTLARRCGVKEKTELLGRSADEVFPSSLGPLYAEQDRRVLRGDAPITEIALRCGYTDHSAFSRQFKALTGLSPSQYRETHRQPRKA